MSDIQRILKDIHPSLKISKEAQTRMSEIKKAYLAQIISGIPRGSKPLTPQQIVSLITKTIPGELAKHAARESKNDLPGSRGTPGLPDPSILDNPNIPRGNAVTNLMVARALDFLVTETIDQAAMNASDTLTIDDVEAINDPEITPLINLVSKTTRNKTYQLPLQPLDGGKTISTLSGFNLMQIANTITGGKLLLSKTSCELLHRVLVDVLLHLISIERGRMDKYTGKSSDEYVISGTLRNLAGIGSDSKIPQFVPYLESRTERKKEYLKSTDLVSAAAIATLLEKAGKTVHPSVSIILSVLYEELAADVMDAAIDVGGDLNPASLLKGMKRSAPLMCFLPSGYKFPSEPKSPTSGPMGLGGFFRSQTKPKSKSGPRTKSRSHSPSAPHRRPSTTTESIAGSTGPARGRSEMINTCAGRKSKSNPFGVAELIQLLSKSGLSTSGNKQELCTRAVDNGLIQ